MEIYNIFLFSNCARNCLINNYVYVLSNFEEYFVRFIFLIFVINLLNNRLYL